jgi:ubiquinone/menaquinone biosynthesis C-methylase UbiE
MDNFTDNLPEKIRQQFDSAPYPNIPIEHSPSRDAHVLFIHNLVTPYYLKNQEIIETENTVILDAACGTGYTTLILAEANPGAKIIGVDISDKSIEIAHQRLEYHGCKNVEFYVMPIEKLPEIGWEFDYINCDDTLYLFSEPALGLQAMKSVLKPQGIIRGNLHSALQRHNFYRGQKIFKMMGLMDTNPEDMEIEIVAETLQSLKDTVNLKEVTWNEKYAAEDLKEWVLMNFLFQGDKGYTIPEMFAALKAADLEFISMVNWRQWELADLFQEPDNLPWFLGMSLLAASVEEKLHLFELFQPIHRLLDFWCGYPQQAKSFKPVSEWTIDEWLTSRVHLHPQLKTPQVKADLIDCISNNQAFKISHYLKDSSLKELEIEVHIAASLLPLWEGAQSFTSLVEQWMTFMPEEVYLESDSKGVAFETIKNLLITLEVFLYVLVEQVEG